MVELCSSARLELYALWPDAPLTIELLDGGGSTLLRRVLRPLGLSETREVQLVVSSSLRRLTGTVTDRRGIPIPGAIINVASTFGGQRKVSDQEGRFALDAVSGEVALRIKKEGYVVGHFDDVSPPADESPLLFELEKGLTTHLSIVDELGRPISGASFSVEISASSDQLSAEEIDPGSYWINDLPPWEVPIHASIAGRRYTIDHSADSGDAAIVVPPHAPLTIELHASARQTDRTIYVVILQPLDDGPQLMLPVFDGIQDGMIQLPNVPTGDYRLIVARAPGGEYWIHEQPVEVDSLEGAQVRLAP